MFLSVGMRKTLEFENHLFEDTLLPNPSPCLTSLIIDFPPCLWMWMGLAPPRAKLLLDCGEKKVYKGSSQ